MATNSVAIYFANGAAYCLACDITSCVASSVAYSVAQYVTESVEESLGNASNVAGG